MRSFIKALMLCAAGCGSAWAATVNFQVAVNTLAIAGLSGHLVFQLNTTGTPAPTTVDILSFTNAGGNFSGVSTPFTLNDNDASLFPVIFGDSFGFQMQMTSAALDAGGPVAGTSFALSLFDETFTTALLTTDAGGSVLTLNILDDHTLETLTFDADDSGTPSPVGLSVTEIPEPGGLVLLGGGLLLVGVGHLRRQSRT